MKNTMSLCLCFVLILSLAGCAQPEPDPPAPQPDPEWETGDAEYPFINVSIQVTAPKTAYNPLTGEYNLAADYVGVRPICVDINNIDEAWPQSGICAADVLIEAPTEGGITRMIAVYSDIREVAKVGSVRSIRRQFIDIIYPLDPVLVCWGWGMISDDEMPADMALIDCQYTDTCYKDKERSKTKYTEHCMFTNSILIAKSANDLGIPQKSNTTVDSFFAFAASGETIMPQDGTAVSVKFNFSYAKYDGDFRYDQETGKYLKFQRGEPQIDVGTGDQNEQLAFTNVLVLFSENVLADAPSGLMDFYYNRGGKGYYFSGGRYEEITWKQPDNTKNFAYYRADGTALVLNPGKTMLCVAYAENINTMQIR